MRILTASLLALTTSLALAAAQPYDEAADAKADIKAALVKAQQTKVPVLVVFGANWCTDCKVLDMAIKSGSSAALIDKSFQVVKVDVGRFDRNLDIAEAYGVPVKQGIPAVAILAADGKASYATRSGEVADARQMGDQGIYDFFVKAAARAK